MAMTVREAFDKHTEAFNSHDIDAFAVTLADDAAFRAPGGMAGEGKAACVQFFGGWLSITRLLSSCAEAQKASLAQRGPP